MVYLLVGNHSIQLIANISVIDVGREVIDQIVARGKVELIVLMTRKVKTRSPAEQDFTANLWAEQASDLGLPDHVKAITFDYVDPVSLAHALRGVHTLLSFIAIADVQLFASIQIKLVDACVANGVKRFAPSEWAT